MNHQLLRGLILELWKVLCKLTVVFFCVALAPQLIYWLITGESVKDVSGRAHGVLLLLLATGGILILPILDRLNYRIFRKKFFE